MWKLTRPNVSAETAFTTCISRVRDQSFRQRLQAATQVVVNESLGYTTAGTHQSLHNIARNAVVNDNVTTKEMEGVYTKRMAKQNSPGRTIYDEIFSAPKNGRCPLCGHRIVTQLDHLLPKAHYPVLAVTPDNLVPSCSDCNRSKLHAIPQSAAEVPLHPYFDNVENDRWLRAEVLETNPSALRFWVDAPDNWSPILKQRVGYHFNLLGLHKLYAAVAAEELVDIRFQLQRLHSSTGAAGVRLHLQEQAASRLSARSNSWSTAAYEAWASSDWFVSGGFQ